MLDDKGQGFERRVLVGGIVKEHDNRTLLARGADRPLV